MNKKGFTLVEVISVIAILALIIIVVSTKGFGAFENTKKKIFEETKAEIKEAANVLMVEVEHCDDKLDTELLSNNEGSLLKINELTNPTCKSLKEKSKKTSEDNKDNMCLRIPVSYLYNKGYITGANVEAILISNPEMTFYGCLEFEEAEDITTEVKETTVTCKVDCEYRKPTTTTTTTEANYPTVDFDYPSNKELYISRTYPAIDFTIEDLLKDLKIELNTKAYEKVQHTEIFLNEEPLCYPGNFKSFDYKSCGDYDVANMIKSLPEKETYEVNLDVRVWVQDQNEESGFKIFSDSFNLKINEVNPVINISYPENKTIYFEEESNGLADISEIFNGLQIDIKDVELNDWIENIGIVLEGQSICDFKGEYKEGMCKPSKVDMNNVRSNAGIFEKQDEYIFNLRVYVALKKGIYTEETFSVKFISNRKPTLYTGTINQEGTFYAGEYYTGGEIFGHVYLHIEDYGSGKNKLAKAKFETLNQVCEVTIVPNSNGTVDISGCTDVYIWEESANSYVNINVEFFSEDGTSIEWHNIADAIFVSQGSSQGSHEGTTGISCVSCDKGCIDDHLIDGDGDGRCCSCYVNGVFQEYGCLYTQCPGY